MQQKAFLNWANFNFKDCICQQEFEFKTFSKEKALMTLIIMEVYPGQNKRVAISDIIFNGYSH